VIDCTHSVDLDTLQLEEPISTTNKNTLTTLTTKHIMADELAESIVIAAQKLKLEEETTSSVAGVLYTPGKESGELVVQDYNKVLCSGSYYINTSTTILKL